MHLPPHVAASAAHDHEILGIAAIDERLCFALQFAAVFHAVLQAMRTIQEHQFRVVEPLDRVARI
jgi:hypothetical protein